MIKHLQILILLSTVLLLTAWPRPADAADINVDTSSFFISPGYSKKISMDFQDATLVDVLKIFSQQTNLNLISSEELASKHVTVYLDNVPVEQALEQVLRANNLTYELQPDSNIYIVKPMTKPDAEMLTRVYILKHASVSTARIKKTLKIVYSTGKSETTTVTDDDSSSGSSSSSGTDSPGILGAIKAVITSKGKVIEDPRTNSLTVSDIAINFNNIEMAIAKLDIPVPQVLIEVEMLEVSKENADLIGIKYGDTPLTFTGAERDVVYPWNQNKLLAKGYEFADAEYRVGTIAASGMTAALQFLSTQSDTKNLARPRILTISNQPAQIKISTDEAVGLSQSQSSSQGSSISTNQAERIETGVFLTVTPQVDTVNQQITMAVVPKVITTRPSTITSGGNTLKDPEERGSLSILRIQSGDTVVLGGLLREDKTTITTKLPFLGDIPLIGSAFRHKNDTVKNRELIIFLTPHILEDNLAENNEKRIRPIQREQGTTANRLKTVERALTSAQNKKM